MDVEFLPVPVISLDANRAISAMNVAAARLLKADPKAVIGRSITDGLRPRTLSGQDIISTDWHPSAYLHTASRIVEQEVVMRCGDGSEIEVLVEGGYERDGAGELLGATLLMRSRYRGHRRPRSGVRIVSAVSHELRSPLTSVRGYTALLLKRGKDISDDDRKMMLTQIDRDARRISRLIGELLDISRIEIGSVQLSRVEMDLGEVITIVIDRVGLTWPQLEATVSLAETFPKVWADVDKVEQVLTNLVENACKYASPKGISIAGNTEGHDVVVEVTDRGPGILSSDMPRLFQQFFRPSQGRPSGTGLGLWISRGLIEAHGGHLTATSSIEGGSTFRFTLPQRAFDELHGTLKSSFAVDPRQVMKS